ncbi:hypothetical protein XENOCAPTIV_015082 [Xenoophorus captivus]|uniref:Uncharacterized protein n=1 Tax=Xenoophorus captivus TaxID=1517983 RepID=A0ABV0QRY0_9TELE
MANFLSKAQIGATLPAFPTNQTHMSPAMYEQQMQILTCQSDTEKKRTAGVSLLGVCRMNEYNKNIQAKMIIFAIKVLITIYSHSPHHSLLALASLPLIWRVGILNTICIAALRLTNMESRNFSMCCRFLNRSGSFKSNK